MTKRIALIHVPAYRREGGLTQAITRRICELALYAARTGADGILFNCSVFTPAEELAKQLVSIPLLHRARRASQTVRALLDTL